MKQYEIINPSDACTVEAEDSTVAAVAILLLSEGAYGCRDEEGNDFLPPLVFGGEEAVNGWLESVGIGDLGEYVNEKREAIAAVLDSAMYGKFVDRRAYKKGLELIDDEAKRKEWRDAWEDDRRTSMTKICQAAWSYARALRARGS